MPASFLSDWAGKVRVGRCTDEYGPVDPACNIASYTLFMHSHLQAIPRTARMSADCQPTPVPRAGSADFVRGILIRRTWMSLPSGPLALPSFSREFEAIPGGVLNAPSCVVRTRGGLEIYDWSTGRRSCATMIGCCGYVLNVRWSMGTGKVVDQLRVAVGKDSERSHAYRGAHGCRICVPNGWRDPHDMAELLTGSAPRTAWLMTGSPVQGPRSSFPVFRRLPVHPQPRWHRISLPIPLCAFISPSLT
jgi:hypothetical protein